MSKNKIISIDRFEEIRSNPKAELGKVGFTNGCFDILHAGHVECLQKARALCDTLIVGLNSDRSVSRIKGPDRPINSQSARALVLAALECVDMVMIFDEDTPYELVSRIRPDVLVKGGDWKAEDIAGSDIVRSYGGRVVIIELSEGFSTTSLIDKISERYNG